MMGSSSFQIAWDVSPEAAGVSIWFANGRHACVGTCDPRKVAGIRVGGPVTVQRLLCCFDRALASAPNGNASSTGPRPICCTQHDPLPAVFQVHSQLDSGECPREQNTCIESRWWFETDSKRNISDRLLRHHTGVPATWSHTRHAAITNKFPSSHSRSSQYKRLHVVGRVQCEPRGSFIPKVAASSSFVC